MELYNESESAALSAAIACPAMAWAGLYARKRRFQMRSQGYVLGCVIEHVQSTCQA
jgi:hypothetical protein